MSAPPVATSPYRLGNAKPLVAAGSPVVGIADPAGTVVNHSLAAVGTVGRVNTADLLHIALDLADRIVKDHTAMAAGVVEHTADIAQVVRILHTPPVSLEALHQSGCHTPHRSARLAHFAVRNSYKNCLMAEEPLMLLSAYSRRNSYKKHSLSALPTDRPDMSVSAVAMALFLPSFAH